MDEFTLAKNIRRLRRERNVSQAALADYLDISIQAVSKWECGNSCPDIASIPAIAAYFGVSIDELFREDGSLPTTVIRGSELPDDGVFRVVQAVGRHILKAEQYNENKTVRIMIGEGDPIPQKLEFCAPTQINGDLTCQSLTVRGNLRINGTLSAETKQIDGVVES